MDSLLSVHSAWWVESESNEALRQKEDLKKIADMAVTYFAAKYSNTGSEEPSNT